MLPSWLSWACCSNYSWVPPIGIEGSCEIFASEPAITAPDRWFSSKALAPVSAYVPCNVLNVAACGIFSVPMVVRFDLPAASRSVPPPAFWMLFYEL